MLRFQRALTILLLTALQVGMLPVWAGTGSSNLAVASAELECGCCAPEAVCDCCCAPEADTERDDDGCPCTVEQPGPVLPTLPPRPGVEREQLPAPALASVPPGVALATGVPHPGRVSRVAPRPVARAGPARHRLFGVDRL